jgi:hypothetical protein
MTESATPNVITLNMTNSIELLSKYIEVAQKAGTFMLAESDLLKRSRDVLMHRAQDNEINTHTAKNLFIQAVNKGQSKGAYTLEDASIIHKICQFVLQNIKEDVIFPNAHTQQEKTLENTVQTGVNESEDLSDDLDDLDDLDSLSEPVPLRTVPRVI